MSLDVKLFILLCLFALIGIVWMSVILSCRDDVPKKKLIIIDIISLICCCGIVLLARYSIYKAFTDERTEQSLAISEDPPDRQKYDKDNREHWGDCISPTPKEDWTPTPFDIRYKDLEAGKTYNFTATLGRSYGRPNEGENIDEIKGSFTPADSEGSVEYVFYTNPKWVKDGKYTILLELDE